MANLARRQREREPEQLFRFDPFRTFRELLRWDPFGEMDMSRATGEAMFVPDVELKETPDELLIKVHASILGDGSNVALSIDTPNLEVTPTEGVIFAETVMRSLGIELFELGMWQMWGRP